MMKEINEALAYSLIQIKPLQYLLYLENTENIQEAFVAEALSELCEASAKPQVSEARPNWASRELEKEGKCESGNEKVTSD